MIEPCVCFAGLAIRLQHGIIDCLAGHLLDCAFHILRRSGDPVRHDDVFLQDQRKPLNGRRWEVVWFQFSFGLTASLADHRATICSNLLILGKRFIIREGSLLRDARPQRCPWPSHATGPGRAGAVATGTCARFRKKNYFVSEASVYRLLKEHHLIASPAYIVMKAADEFKDKTTAPNQLWQTDFTISR